MNEDIENYVDKYYSIEKFKETYSGRVPSCVDKSQWPKGNHGFFLYPPLLRKVAGRPRTLRIKQSHEPGAKKKGTSHQCPVCKGFGHHWKNCKEGDPTSKEALQALAAAKMKAEKKRATKKSIAQALATIGAASSSTSTKISACGSSEIEAPGNLAMVTAAAPRKEPNSSMAGKIKITTRRTKKRNESAPKEKKGSVAASRKKKQGSASATAPKKGKKRSSAEPKPSTPSKKCKKQSAATPSTPSKCKIALVLPHSPAMGTRSKVKEKSLSQLLA